MAGGDGEKERRGMKRGGSKGRGGEMAVWRGPDCVKLSAVFQDGGLWLRIELKADQLAN